MILLLLWKYYLLIDFVAIHKASGPLGLSIVGGADRTSSCSSSSNMFL